MPRSRATRTTAAGVLLSFAVAAFMVVGVAMPANAVETFDPLDTADIRHLDFPAPANASAWKTTVPASVITGASRTRAPAGGYVAYPPKTQAARTSQIASTMRQTNAAAALSRANGPSVREWTEAQKSPPKVAASIESVRSKFVIPAAVAKPLEKITNVLGGATLLLGGLDLGFSLGKGVSNMFGMDVTGGLCNPTFDDGGLIAAVTGTDCSEFLALAPDFSANEDAEGGLAPGQTLCGPNGYYCLEIIKAHPTVAVGNTSGTMTYCINVVLPPAGTQSQFWGAGAMFGGVKTDLVSQHYTHCGPSGAAAAGGWTNAFQVSGRTDYMDSWCMEDAGGKCQTTGPGALKPFETLSGDPERVLECTIVAVTGETFTATSEPYRESGGVLPQPVCPAIPDGLIGGQVTVTPTNPGGPQPQPIYSEPTTPEYQTLLAHFPECASGLCYADLRKGNPLGTGTETLSCFDDLDQGACAGWSSDPNAQTVYECQYGGQVVALSECNHYAPTFDPDKTQQGISYADPQTGVSAPVGNAPRPSSVMNTPLQDPELERNCYPEGWSALNPVEWVVKPVGCALEKAFVPRASHMADKAEEISEAWEATAPAQLFDAIAGWNINFSVDGCQGIPFMFKYGDTETNMGIPSACPGEPLAEFAGQMRIAGSIVLLIVSGLAIRRHAGASIGFNA